VFDTKIALVLREDLAVWQKLNVTAFLTSGILGTNNRLIGLPYADADGNTYAPLIIQPVVVLSASESEIRRAYSRAMGRDANLAIYIEDMFETGHDAANRAAVSLHKSDALNLVGIAMREDKKIVDKITKGLKLHT
jgi:hypothetical protein